MKKYKNVEKFFKNGMMKDENYKMKNILDDLVLVTIFYSQYDD